MVLEILKNFLPLMAASTIVQQICFDEVGIQKWGKFGACGAFVGFV